MRRFEVMPGRDPSTVILPRRSTKFSAGYDFFVPLDVEPIVVYPGERVYIPTGVTALIPTNEFVQLSIRSGYARNHGLILMDGVGIVDADYYGEEIGFTIYNSSKGEYPFFFIPAQKIGQGVIQEYKVVDDEPEIANVRTGGFGSTSNFEHGGFSHC